MTVQVVTPENVVQFITTGKVDEIKPAEAAVQAEPKEAPVKEVQDKAPETPRGPDGKFTKQNDGDNHAGTGATPETDDEEGSDDLPEKVRKTIGKKHRQMKEAEEFARSEYSERRKAEQRAEQAEAKLREFEAKSRPAPKEESQAPKPEDFANVGEYTAALVKFEVDKARAEERAKQAEERAREEGQRAQEALAARVRKAMKDIPDYVDVIKAADRRLPGHMSQYVTESEVGALIAYELAKMDEDDFTRLAKLSPVRAIAELGKLEARLEAKSTAPAKTEQPKPPAESPANVSKAPSPVQPIDASAAVVVQKDPSKMTFQELREHRRQEMIRKSQH